MKESRELVATGDDLDVCCCSLKALQTGRSIEPKGILEIVLVPGPVGRSLEGEGGFLKAVFKS